MSASPEPTAEDAKLVTLARSARARSQAAEGAAVRDDMGRTYAAATVALPSLQLSALQAAVAAAVSSGSDRLEAAVVVTDSLDLAPEDRAVIADLAIDTVLSAAPDGSVRGA
jgi:cytidine deaminase